jgi:hypothetical protein
MSEPRAQTTDLRAPEEIVKRLRSLTDLTPGVTAIADETLFKDAADKIERLTQERLLIADEFAKRADWLRSEYLNGGAFEHLKAREDECRYLAERVRKGITP